MSANTSTPLLRRIGGTLDRRTPLDFEKYFQYYLRLKDWTSNVREVRVSSKERTKILNDIASVSQSVPQVTTVVVGARNKPWRGDLEPLHEAGLLDLHTIEPDPAECERLADLAPPHYTFHSVALSDSVGEETLFLTEAEATSSLYKPRPEEFHSFPWIQSKLDIKDKKRIQTETLDKLCSEEEITIDCLLLDTQGSECDILRGAGDALNSIQLMQLEARTVPMYEDEALLHEILEWLYDAGFQVLDLDFNRWGKSGFVNELSRAGKRDYRLNAETIEVHSLVTKRRAVRSRKAALRKIVLAVSFGKIMEAKRTLHSFPWEKDPANIRAILADY